MFAGIRASLDRGRGLHDAHRDAPSRSACCPRFARPGVRRRRSIFRCRAWWFHWTKARPPSASFASWLTGRGEYQISAPSTGGHRSSRRHRGAGRAADLVGRHVRGILGRAGRASSCSGPGCRRRRGGADRRRLSAAVAPVLESRFGPSVTDTGLAVATAAAYTATQAWSSLGGMTLFAAIQNSRVPSASTQLGTARSPLGRARRQPRSVSRDTARPLPPGPVERHGDRSALAQIVGAAAIGAPDPEPQCGCHRRSGGGPQGHSHRAGMLREHARAGAVRRPSRADAADLRRCADSTAWTRC